MQRGAVGVVGSQDVLEAGLRGVGRPVGGGDDGLLSLAGGADQLAAVEVGLR